MDEKGHGKDDGVKGEAGVLTKTAHYEPVVIKAKRILTKATIFFTFMNTKKKLSDSYSTHLIAMSFGGSNMGGDLPNYTEQRHIRQELMTNLDQ